MNHSSLITTDAVASLLVTGLLLLVILLVKVFLHGRWLPPMIVYIVIGMLVGTGLHGEWLPVEKALPGLRLLAEAGLVMLLFKAGLDADLKDLGRQLPNASWIWFWNVLVSAVAGFVAARYWVGLDQLSSVFIAVALTATSVGVTVSLWDEAGQLKTHEGSLLLDVAELDDLSTICLVAVLVAVAPLVATGEDWVNAGLAAAIGQVLLALAVFLALVAAFSLLLEPRLTAFFERHTINHESVIFVLAVSFIIASLAEFAGLSLAIGAFLAGLAFSRDDRMTQERPVIRGLTDFLTPFFFIGLGLLVKMSAFIVALWPAALLLVAAIVGKLVGVGVPAWPRLGPGMALLLAVSMIPRSEIAMIVMQRGLQVGVSERAFAAMVIISLVTVLVAVLAVPWLLRRKAG